MKSALLNHSHLPTPKQEEWKYTNLPKAMPQGLTPSSQNEKTVIHIARGQGRGQTEDILWTGRDGVLHMPELEIVLEEGQELTVIERHDGRGGYWKNMATAIRLEKGAILHHIRIQDDSADSVHTNMVEIVMERDAVYNGFALNLGGKLTRHEIHAVMDGVNGECTFNGINLLRDKQHGDTTIVIEHKAPHGRSYQFYRTLLDDTARGVFQGKVHVHQAAQKTDGYQLSNALLLSPGAEMDTKPELEIYADDVKCSHGATTGQLDEAPLFYLRSRGLDEGAARLLLLQAFVDELVDKLGDDVLRSSVKEKTNQWLQQTLSK